jgi:hypothetical protein
VIQPEPAHDFDYWVDVAVDLGTVLAIVIGALWAGFKFKKFRTLKQKAEQSVEGELLGSSDGTRAIRARVALGNRGATKMPLRWCFVGVFAVWDPASKWTPIGGEPVLEHHDSLEPGEPITDEVLIPLVGNEKALAYRLEFIVHEQDPKGGDMTEWITRTVVPGELQPVGQEAHRSTEGTGE